MIQIQNVRGRWPERRIPLRTEDMWVTTDESEPGKVRVRMENARCMAFWLEFDITVPIPKEGSEPCAG